MLGPLPLRQSTQWEHAEQIRRAYGYRDFSDPAVQSDLTGWLAARARTSAGRASVLFDLATARLIEAKVLLPGPSLLERLVDTAGLLGALDRLAEVRQLGVGELDLSGLPAGSCRPTPPTTCLICSTDCWPGCCPATATSAGSCPPCSTACG